MTKLYKTLATLIKDYRCWHQFSQERLADMIGISVRELQNWENDRHRVRIDNLHDLAEATGIPMQVCVSLNADQPIWYSLQERRAAFSSIEAHYVRKDFLKYREISGNETFAISEKISTDKHIAKILSCYCEILGSRETLSRDIIKAAIAILPDLNQILFDYSGHYVGHNICLPLTTAVYQELKGYARVEDFLTTERLSDIIGQQEGVFFCYSIFASTLNIEHQMVMNMARFFVKLGQRDRYIFAYAISGGDDVKQAKKFGMVRAKPWLAEATEKFPQLYETPLDNLMGYLGEGQFLVKRHGGKAATKKTSTMLPPYQGQSTAISNGPVDGLEESALKKRAMSEVSTVGRGCDVLTVGNGLSDASLMRQIEPSASSDFPRNQSSCPNARCPQNGQLRAGRIISYGTYRSKDGVFYPRFLCKDCGKVFRGNAIFRGLRSPEGRILEAFRLLVRGMPLRRVAAVLGIELRTVRHWLNFAAKRSGTIDTALRKALDVSQGELDALWDAVKNGTLSERAILWKKANAAAVAGEKN